MEVVMISPTNSPGAKKKEAVANKKEKKEEKTSKGSPSLGGQCGAEPNTQRKDRRSALALHRDRRGLRGKRPHGV